MNKLDVASGRLNPRVVAHRGDAANYPENTIASLSAAAACGVRHLEFDIQLSADRVPVLLHDNSLVRTAGIDRIVTACMVDELKGTSVGEPDRFGGQFSNEFLPSLEHTLSVLPSKDLTLFVELKRHSLRTFGRRSVLDAVLPVLNACQHDVVIVSFDYGVLRHVREMSSLPVALVLSAYNERAITEIINLAPEYVFCNENRLPGADTPLWCGNWDWVIYEITTADQAKAMRRRGAAYVESMNACKLSAELCN